MHMADFTRPVHLQGFIGVMLSAQVLFFLLFNLGGMLRKALGNSNQR